MKNQVEKIRNELRDANSSSLKRRRKIGVLSAIGMVDFAVISLYQMGVIRHLPDPPSWVFDSDKVNASEKAYSMHLPDGTTGASMYAANLMLASFGGSARTGRGNWPTALLGLTVAASAVGALDYLRDMIFKEKRACPYCLLGAAVNLAMVPLVWKEAKEEFLPKLRGGNRQLV